MYIKDLPDWLPENKYSSIHLHLLVQKTSMHKYTSRVCKNILVKYTEIYKTFPKWYTSQVHELHVHTKYFEVLHVTYLVFLRLQCFNSASSSFHCLQELGILFLSLLQGDFLRLNCTLSLFKLLHVRERRGGGGRGGRKGGREEGREEGSEGRNGKEGREKRKGEKDEGKKREGV